MRSSRSELPILFGEDPASIRGVDWANLRSMIVSLPAGADVASLLKGLPHDQCTCPHWGYVLRGRMRVIYADGEELMQAGDLFYIPPGHVPIVEEDIEFLEFSPPGDHEIVLETVKKNAAGAS
ncbi:MAG: cupin domain-containing protein [Thermomicrobiales bacterium]